MAYETANRGTIDAKVGSTFVIKGQTPVHIDGKLSYSKKDFELVSENQGLLEKLIGSRPKTTYTLKAKRKGNFKIEYQYTKAWEKAVSFAEVYSINVV